MTTTQGKEALPYPYIPCPKWGKPLWLTEREGLTKERSVAQPNRVNLSMPEVVKLSEWMSCNEEWLKTTRPSYPEAAAKAEMELGFEVTDSNVKAMNKAKEMVWVPKGSERESIRAKQTREAIEKALQPFQTKMAEAERLITRLLNDNQKLHAELSSYRGALHELYYQLGAEAPPGYVVPPDPRGRMRLLPGNARK